MLALFASPIFRDAVIALLIAAMIGSGVLYYKYSQAEMLALRTQVVQVQHQADDLAAAKTALENSIAQITVAQNVANKSLMKAQTDAAQAMLAAHNAQIALKTSAKSDPRALENQINTNQAATLKALTDLSQ